MSVVASKRSVFKMYDGVEQLNEYKVDFSDIAKVAVSYGAAAEFSGLTYKFVGSAGTVNDMLAHSLTLRSDVDTAISNNASEITRVEGLITAEETSRIAGDASSSTARSAIQSALNAEITRASAAEVVNANAVVSEAASRSSADQLIEENLTAETAARNLAVSNLDTAYKAADSALDTAYKAADTALDAKINTEKARIDAILNLSSSDLDTFKEIVTAYTNADSNLQTLINTLTSTIAQLRADFDAHINP